MRTTVLLCLLYLLCQPAWGDGRSAQQLSELDSRSHLLCASAMVYFNPQDRSPDPRSLTAVFHHLNMLETYVMQLGQPPQLLQPVTAMKRVFAKLDGLSRAQSGRYPELVQQLLGHHRQLQLAAADAYDRAQQDPTLSASALLLNAQSQALARLLLDYQLRLYPLPDKGGFVLTPAQLQALDSAIEQRFDSLLAAYSTHAEVLLKVRNNYRFVRAELQQRKGCTQGGAEFYLSRAVLDLDELAMTL